MYYFQMSSLFIWRPYKKKFAPPRKQTLDPPLSLSLSLSPLLIGIACVCIWMTIVLDVSRPRMSDKYMI